MHSALLTLKYLSANEQKAMAAERHWIVGKKAAELKQSANFKHILT